MIASIRAALKAIPEIVDLFKEAVGAINALVASYKKAQTDAWNNTGKELARKIALAETDLERAKLVKELSDNWDNQP